MANEAEVARRLLAQAETFEERTDAVRAAISVGMGLDEIEAFLDWLDATRAPCTHGRGTRCAPDSDLPTAGGAPGTPGHPVFPGSEVSPGSAAE